MRIGWIQKLVNKWPGKKTFGMYRFLPMFFVLGTALEFSMINWKVGEVNFYNTFKKRRAHDIVEDKIRKYTSSTTA
ncbi:hypothetical protein ABMA28_014213 [Loxostege sticticalis]|uniref:Small integral membrane protein 4 n=1 Tax=Loxostege sticticalis TaxID=481309 RepID=A0ABD0TG34_LOXSC